MRKPLNRNFLSISIQNSPKFQDNHFEGDYFTPKIVYDEALLKKKRLHGDDESSPKSQRRKDSMAD